MAAPVPGAATTQERLMSSAFDLIREDGLAAASARAIAARAGVNQALVFYHFGTVSALIEAASNQAVDRSAATYRAQFDSTASLTTLLSLAREVHDNERLNGNVAVMAQLLAGAQRDEVLSRAARYALATWTNELSAPLERALAETPLGERMDARGLAQLMSAGFVGVELIAGVDADGAEQILASVQILAALLEDLGSAGPIVTAALRSRLRRKDRLHGNRERPQQQVDPQGPTP